MKNFDEATAVQQTSANVYSAHFHDDWCIGSVPHGGYVTATLLRVVRTHFSSTLSAQNQPHTIALNAQFLRRTQIGPAVFTVQTIKLGRQTSTVHVSLTQSNRLEVLAYVTNSNIPLESGLSFSTGWRLDPPRPSVHLQHLKQDKDEKWAFQATKPFHKFRKATQRVKFYFPRKGQALKSLVDQWISLESGERWTNDALGFVADVFPQIVEAYRYGTDPYAIPEEDYGAKSEAMSQSKTHSPDKSLSMLWFPTVLLNLDIKKVLPPSGVEFLGVRVRAKTIKNGRMDLEVLILDEEGEVVALSHHVVLIVSAERNTAKRRKREGEGEVAKL